MARALPLEAVTIIYYILIAAVSIPVGIPIPNRVQLISLVRLLILMPPTLTIQETAVSPWSSG